MKYVKITLVAKEMATSNGRKFMTYFAPVKILNKSTNQVEDKCITVKFKKTVNTSQFAKRGVLVAKEENISLPYVYEIKEVNGKKEYPVIWVREVETYNKTKSSAVNTCTPVVEEEQDTEETNID